MDSQTQPTHEAQNEDNQNPSSSGYEPTWPKDQNLPPIYTRDLSQFITRFFQVSDNPDLTEEWLSFFHEKAMLVMGDKAAEGKEEIRTLRKGMWERVKTRKHTVQMVYPARFPRSEFRISTSDTGTGAKDGEDAHTTDVDDEDDDDINHEDSLGFRVCGTVDYTLKKGETEMETGDEDKEEKEERIEWTAPAEVVPRKWNDAAGGDGEEASTTTTTTTMTMRNNSMFVFTRYRVYLSPVV